MFGFKKSVVSELEQEVDSIGGFIEGGNADGDSERAGNLAVDESREFSKPLADFFGAYGGLTERALGQDEGELFATVAAGDVLGADAAEKGLANGGQGLIAGRVSEAVVIALEVVEIEHHHSEGAAFAPRGVQFAIEELLHVAAVVQPGEGVANCLQAKCLAKAEVGN